MRPEYEERYIILHKHTFPGVLKQISASNIRNYSIFLHTGLLFAYYEYLVSDYSADMTRMGENQTTQDWWKLTDPMQEPLENSKEGEWWTVIPEISHYKAQRKLSGRTARWAFCANDFAPERLSLSGIKSYSVFRLESRYFIYLESSSGWQGLTDRQTMREVFHTD